MDVRYQVGQQATRLSESDGWRGILMGTLTSLFPVLQIFGIVDFTAEQIALITVFVGNVTLFIAYFLPSKPAARSGAHERSVEALREHRRGGGQ